MVAICLSMPLKSEFVNFERFKNPLMTKLKYFRADVNSDGSLTLQELAHYINQKVSDHIDTSIKQNSQIFAEVDKNPVDGLISWEEYHQYFLRKIGLDEKYVKTHNENKHIKLDRKSKEILMKDKALWSEVARTDPYSLTLDEFLAFQHPEASTTNLLNLVDDILRHFDVDGDDQLTIEEFTSTHSTNNENKKFFITHDVTERKAEFKRFIDKNYDGKADRGELLTYVDPRHPRHSVLEATTLFNFSDVNKDMVLSLEEVLSHTQLFISSKMISTMENFHDEF